FHNTTINDSSMVFVNILYFEKNKKNWEEIANHSKWVFPAYDQASAKSYLDWVIPALMRHEDNRVLTTDVMDQSVPEEIRKDPSRWKVHVIHESELTNLDKYETEINHSVKEHIENWQTLSLEDERL